MKITAKLIKAAVIVIITGLLVFAVIFSSIIATIIGAENSRRNKTEDAPAGEELVPITITGTYDGKNAALKITGDGISIDGIKGTGDKYSFTAKNKGGKSGSVKLPLPTSSAARLKNGMSYMARMVQSNYTMSLWTGYPGYKLANNMIPGKKMTKDKDGLARVGNDYVIALGSAYVPSGDRSVGYQRYRVTIRNGKNEKSFTAILGDTKKDNETDSKHMFHLVDGSVVEMHVWSYKTPFRNPNAVFPGTLVKLERIGASVARLKGMIKKGKITITGNIDGIEVFAEGTIKDNKIKAEGWYGNGASAGGAAAGGKGVEAMVRWAMQIAKGANKHGYSQANRTCCFCRKGATPDYDCSSFVTAALAHNNMGKDFMIACKNTWPYVTSNIGAALAKNGWKNVGNLPPGKCQRGDIVLNPARHVEICCGGGIFVGAHDNKDGKSGETYDNEITYGKAWGHWWTQVWRYKGGSKN